MSMTPSFISDNAELFAQPVYAQAAGGGDLLMNILPFILMFVIFYFLLIRPQQQQRKKHMEMLAAVKRSDVIVTNGGIVGKVTKVIDENEVEVEIAKDTKIKVVRAMIADVRVKGAPAKAAK